MFIFYILFQSKIKKREENAKKKKPMHISQIEKGDKTKNESNQKNWKEFPLRASIRFDVVDPNPCGADHCTAGG